MQPISMKPPWCATSELNEPFTVICTHIAQRRYVFHQYLANWLQAITMTVLVQKCTTYGSVLAIYWLVITSPVVSQSWKASTGPWVDHQWAGFGLCLVCHYWPTTDLMSETVLFHILQWVLASGDIQFDQLCPSHGPGGKCCLASE